MAHRIVWCVAAPRRRRRPSAHQSAAPDLGVGRSVAHGLDRHVTELAEGGRSGGDAAGVDHVLGARTTTPAPPIARQYSSRTQEERAAGWDRFANGPAPVGYDPAIIPGWDSPDSPEFGILRLTPHRLRVMPGTVMLTGQGELLTWQRLESQVLISVRRRQARHGTVPGRRQAAGADRPRDGIVERVTGGEPSRQRTAERIAGAGGVDGVDADRGVAGDHGRPHRAGRRDLDARRHPS